MHNLQCLWPEGKPVTLCHDATGVLFVDYEYAESAGRMLFPFSQCEKYSAREEDDGGPVEIIYRFKFSKGPDVWYDNV